MEDERIIALYWARDPQAVEETEQKYGNWCRSLSYGILRNRQDAEECVNDTWIRAWNAIPPQRPVSLRAFLSRIVRNCSLQRYRNARAGKRGGGQVPLVLEELTDLLSDGPEAQLEAAELGRLLERLVRQLPEKDRLVFLRRYWYLDSIDAIARRYHMAASSVRASLSRSRKKLKQQLEQEGIWL